MLRLPTLRPPTLRLPSLRLPSLHPTILPVLLLCLLALLPGLARAQCTGTDLLAGNTYAQARATAGADPFGAGNHWRARKGDSTLTLIGTYHIDDPRIGARLPALGALVRAADLLMVEAGPEEIAALQRETLRRPERLFLTTGPTLPDLLGETDWQRLRAQMAARGIPGFLAAKFRPWYVMVLLGMPPCARPDPAAKPGGLDQKLTDAALAGNVPIAALEPFDTVLGLFDALSMAEQLDMLRAGLLTADATQDAFVTTREAYFREDHRLIWEFARAQSLAGPDPGRAQAQFALMQDRLLDRRNLAWMQVILRSLRPGQDAVVAVGAAHLSGETGLLAQLAARGFTLDRQPF